MREPIENSDIDSICEQAKLYGGTCKYAILATTYKLSSTARSELYSVNQQGPPCIIVIDDELWRHYFSNPKTTEKELLEKAIEKPPKEILVILTLSREPLQRGGSKRCLSLPTLSLLNLNF